MVVVLVDVELDFATGVGVTQTQLSTRYIAILKALEQLLSVGSDTTKQIGGNVAGIGGLGVDSGESSLNGTSKVLVLNGEGDWRLAAGLGEVELEVRSQVLIQDTLGNIIDVLQRICGISSHRS